MNIEEAIKKIKEIIYWSNGQKAEYIDISFCTYDDEINCEEFIETIETILNELDKKDKVIDMMNQHIYENTYRDLEECEFEEHYQIKCKKNCKECAKEYFYDKAKENTNER